MARCCFTSITAFICCLCLLPDSLIAAQLVLRPADGSQGTDATATVTVGDEIEVQLWLDSESETISGAAVFLTFDESVFSLVAEDRDPVVLGFQPFARGPFLGNGEIFRNALLDPDDPAAAALGTQMDYSVVRAIDNGSGPTATFRLRATAPSQGSTIRIDESGIRETRFFTPDGTHHPFRFITPLTVRVRGISIEGLPSSLVLARGQVDDTTFHLDDLIFDPVFKPSQIQWTISPGGSLGLSHDLETNLLTIYAPSTSSPWERLVITATNPEGQSATGFVDVFVNAGPVLPDHMEPLELAEDTPGTIDLGALVNDPDTPANGLRWSVEAPPELSVIIGGPPHEALLQPALNWSGAAEIRLVVVDEYDFADTTAVTVTVAAVNDPPRITVAPNVRLIRGRSDSTLVLGQLLSDVEDDLTKLSLSWTGDAEVSVERRGDRLVLTAPPTWEGAEVIELRVEDSGGLAATAPLTVTVVRSLAPALIDAPDRLGLAAGEHLVLELQELVVDPDDLDSELVWRLSGQEQLRIQLSSTGAARVEAPSSFTGTEVVSFAVTDPTGESASFDVLFFAASANGEPAIAPLPQVAVPPGGVDASIDLDDYVFDLDHGPEDMEWFLPAHAGVELQVDPVSHVLTIAVADSAEAASLELQVRVRDPAGQEAVQLLPIRILGDGGQDPPPIAPPDPQEAIFSPLPALALTAGELDQSILIDDYVEGVDPAELTWQVTGQQHLQAFVDPGTRRLTILAGSDWSGAEILAIRGVDALGNALLEGLLGVQVEALRLDLELRDLTEISLLAGDAGISLDLADLVLAGADPTELMWEATGLLPIAVAYDDSTGSLSLQSAAFQMPGGQLISLVARDGLGHQATGRVLAHVHPVDGTYGRDSDQFDLVVVPNAVQPDFLDVFVLSDQQHHRRPRLRLEDGDWSELTVTSTQAGIWHSRHVLRSGMEGPVRFLALTMDMDQDVIKSDFAIQVGTAIPASGKRIAMAGIDVDLGAHSFADEAVVALIPGQVGDAGPELVPLARSFAVHATRPYTGESLRVSLELPHAGPTEGAALYRWDGTRDRWMFLGDERKDGWMTAVTGRTGRFALLADATPPALVAVEAGGREARFRWRDAGSGISGAALAVDGVPLSAARYSWEGDWLCVDLRSHAASSAHIEMRVTDRAGNAAVAVKALALLGASTPDVFELGQNYPNPFNPTTVIPFSLSADSNPVRVEIFNAAGQRVRLLLDQIIDQGPHEITWDGIDNAGFPVSSGLYLYRVSAGTQARTRKMSLMR